MKSWGGGEFGKPLTKSGCREPSSTNAPFWMDGDWMPTLFSLVLANHLGNHS